jgi:hypothetical protein
LLGLVTFGPVVRQKMPVGSVWQRKMLTSWHLEIREDKKGLAIQHHLEGHASDNLTFSH